MTKATATKTWRDASPVAAESLEGKHDAELNYISQAWSARLKGMFRKGAKIEVTSGQMMGKTGVVLKVNPKRISVGLGEKRSELHPPGFAGSAWEYESWSDGEWNIPPSMLQVIS
jgi:hypothetical protein